MNILHCYYTEGFVLTSSWFESNFQVILILISLQRFYFYVAIFVENTLFILELYQFPAIEQSEQKSVGRILLSIEQESLSFVCFSNNVMLHHGNTLYEYNSILTMTKTVIAIYPFKPRFFELMTRGKENGQNLIKLKQLYMMHLVGLAVDIMDSFSNNGLIQNCRKMKNVQLEMYLTIG